MRGWLLNRVTLTFGVIAGVVIAWNFYVGAHDDGILTGRVVDADGQPVAGATVILLEKTIVSLAPIGEALTGNDGSFSFDKHDRHVVVLTAEKDGVGQSGRMEVRLYFRNQNRALSEPVRLTPAG